MINGCNFVKAISAMCFTDVTVSCILISKCLILFYTYLQLLAGCSNDPEPLLCVVLKQHRKLGRN